MELEFDKEIDAILRKKVAGAAVSPKTAHLDADEIAAFAENALPANTRLAYTRHLADCDRCRNVLAQTISFYPEAAIEPASSDVSDSPLSDPAMPWYQRLFAVPNLAASMGALVLAFAGLLGYLVFQQNFSNRPEVAELNKSETAHADRNYNQAQASAANAASNAANSSANTESPTITSGQSPMTKTLGQEEPVQPSIGADQPSDTGVSRPRSELPPPPASAPLAKEEAKKPEMEDDRLAEKKAVTESNRSLSVDGADAKAKADEITIAKDAPLQNNQAQNNAVGGAIKSKSGPYRDMQQRNSTLDKTRADSASGVAGENAAGRRVAGRSFEKKDGVWYDSAYRGQPTINIRRGTGEYKILDSGLRKIAENIGGTVVILWREKAYRIQ